MTVTGGGADDDATRVDRQPPAFPSVGDSQGSNSASTSGAAPLFAAPAADQPTAERSPITSQPINPPSSGGGSRVRWLVAGLATLLVVVLVGGALFLAAPRAGAASATAHYVSADTGMYAEIRLDLPGDQHDNLAAFMSHFPGFADQAAFQQKLDETLNSVLARNGADLSWTEDVKPWFGGQLAFFGNAGPPGEAATTLPAQTGFLVAQHPGVIALTVADKAKLQAEIDSHADVTTTTSDYQGFQIKTVVPLENADNVTTSTSYVITDDVVLISSDVSRLQESLDTKLGQSKALADDAFFTQQLAALHADRLATVYLNAAETAMPLNPGPGAQPQCAGLTGSVNTVKAVGEMRAEKDHMAFTLRAQPPTGDNALPLTQNKQSTLAQSMPSDTIAYLELHGVGSKVSWLIKNGLPCLTGVQSTPGGPLPSGLDNLGGMGDPSELFEQFLGAKPEDYFDFIDDAAIGVTYTNDELGGGLVATVDDANVATQRVAKLVSLVKLLGSGLGGGFGSGSSSTPQISTEELDHNGTKVTVIHVGSAIPGQAPLTLQVAVANGRLYLGLGDFVTSALDRTATDSLASNARYQKALSAASADNAGIVYVDMPAFVDLYGESLSQESGADFETNVGPFLEPLGSFSVVNHLDGGIFVSNGFLFVE